MRVFGFAAWSGSGKTTLVEKLLPVIIARGVSVSTIKHAHHDFDLDQEGKDSWRHRKAGASEVLIASSTRWALLHELRGAKEPDLAALLDRMSPIDLVLIEGFKYAPVPKLEIIRPSIGKPPLFPADDTIRGVAAVESLPEVMRVACPLPIYDADDVEGIAGFVLATAVRWIGTK